MNTGPLIVIVLAFGFAVWIHTRQRAMPWRNGALFLCVVGMIGGALWNYQLSQSSERVDFSAALNRRDQACGWLLGERLRRDGAKQVLVLNEFNPAETAAWQSGFQEGFGASPLVRELTACSVDELDLSPEQRKSFGRNPDADRILLRFNTLSISRAAEASSADAVVLCGHGTPRIIEKASLSHLPRAALAHFTTGDDLAPLRELLPAGLLVCRPLPILPQDQGAELRDIAQRCFKLE